ncbi:MAG: hypothetical protein IJ987_08065 [Firmicutes bacterium]|nr:hypothetical protein [Bacillota bacterium]
MTNKTYRFAAVAAVLLMLCLVFMAPVAADAVYSGGEGTSASPYQISTVDDLKNLSTAVSSGTSYSGKFFTLTEDLDLENKEWTPIGNSNKKFSGNFDGGYHTISNLLITGENSDVGLFGFTKDGAIGNLTVHNAKVSGYLDVGVISGTPYTSTYTNIMLTGHVEVNGYAYVGGLFGKNLYANADNLTINVDDTSYVRAESENYRTYVGGVVGFMGEGGHKVSNVQSNIDVYGSTCDVGGITGIAHYNNKFENCVCTGDVTLINSDEAGYETEIGGIAGVWHNNAGTTVTFTNCKYFGTLKSYLNGVESTDFKYGGLVGRPYSTSGTGTLVLNNVKVGDVFLVYQGVSEFTETGTYKLMEAIELESSLIIDKAITLDLNGYTLSSSTDTVVVSGTSASLTVQDSSAEKTGKITTSGKNCGAIWVHSGSSVTLKSGILNSTYSSADGDSVAVYAGSTTETNKHSKTSFVMDGGKLEAMDYGLCIYNGTATINSGEITANLGISGNGGDGDGTTLIINGGTITSIYHPQNGLLTINGGTITGETAIYFKSGSLSITDGNFIGNGDKADYAYKPSGCDSTGDALVIENVGANGYEAISSVSISGGAFTSKYAEAVGSYTAGNEGVTALTAFITGGTFSSNPSAYIASGYEVVQPGDKYLVQKYVDRSSSSSSSSTTEPEEPEQPEEPVVEPETPAAPGEVASSTEVTDGGEVAFETTVVDDETGEQSAPAAADDEVKGVVLPTGTEGTVEFVPVSEQPAPAGQEENTKRVFEINVPSYKKGEACRCRRA